MHIRDRIKDLRRVPAKALRPHPKNWRTHPEHQRDALQGVLAEIGYADALLARELPDGSLELIDGHLRAETTPEAEVPVLVLDLNDAEADKLLALLDPLAAMAGSDVDTLAALLSGVETENEAVRRVLDDLVHAETDGAAAVAGESTQSEPEIPEAYQVVVQCDDEAQQQEVFERLTAEGLSCRLLNL
jgi:ParB-like chromosome segregation protein Spo0J